MRKRFHAGHEVRGITLLVVVMGMVFAENPRIGGRFRVPEVNEDGVLTSMFTGESARMVPGRPVEITGMRIFFFEPDGSTVRMEVRSPLCFYDERRGNATSDEEVEIQGDQFTVTGKKFKYNAAEQRLEIFQDAKVVLRGLGALSVDAPASAPAPAPKNESESESAESEAVAETSPETVPPENP